MLRLELAAQVANAQAEVEAMAADAAVEGGPPVEIPAPLATDSVPAEDGPANETTQTDSPP